MDWSKTIAYSDTASGNSMLYATCFVGRNDEGSLVIDAHVYVNSYRVASQQLKGFLAPWIYSQRKKILYNMTQTQLFQTWYEKVYTA
jgi:hypothetical protein